MKWLYPTGTEGITYLLTSAFLAGDAMVEQRTIVPLKGLSSFGDLQKILGNFRLRRPLLYDIV